MYIYIYQIVCLLNYGTLIGTESQLMAPNSGFIWSHPAAPSSEQASVDPEASEEAEESIAQRVQVPDY